MIVFGAFIVIIVTTTPGIIIVQEHGQLEDVPDNFALGGLVLLSLATITSIGKDRSHAFPDMWKQGSRIFFLQTREGCGNQCLALIAV